MFPTLYPASPAGELIEAGNFLFFSVVLFPELLAQGLGIKGIQGFVNEWDLELGGRTIGSWTSQMALVVKNLLAKAGDERD